MKRKTQVVILGLTASVLVACTSKVHCPAGQAFVENSDRCQFVDGGFDVGVTDTATDTPVDPCSRCTGATPVCLRLGETGVSDVNVDAVNLDASIDGVVCVECIEDMQCGTNRVCSPQHTCVECLNDAQCLARDNGLRPICDPARNICRRTRGLCSECAMGDIDCNIGYRCAYPNYMGGDAGMSDAGARTGYCLPEPMGGSCMAPAGLPQTVQLFGGDTALLCQPAASISCGALANYNNNNNNCVSSLFCEMGGAAPGARCEEMRSAGDRRCTVSCSVNEECRTSNHMSTDTICTLAGYCAYTVR